MTNGLTNEQIYTRIINGHEIQGPGGMDKVVDLRVRTISKEVDGNRWIRNCRPNSLAKTIGIDGKGDGVTALCPQKLKAWYESNDFASLAGHCAHEYMHIIGFSHPGRRKNLTVVYKVGSIIVSIISNEAEN